jgi:iron(III) transport system substrate-binding protein
VKRLVAILVVLAAIVGGALYLLWPKASKGLVLYSAVDYGPAVAKAFKQQTGIDVTVVDISTGALLAKVSAEGHRPAWSLVWFDGDLAAIALDQAGLLAKHTTPDLPYTGLGKSLVPADGSYTPTGVTLAGAFTYHPSEIKDPPKHWPDLLSPSLKGVVGMNNPAISGPTYPILAGMLHQAGGWPQGQGFVTRLAHEGLHVYAKNSNTLAALRGGDIKLAVTQSSAAWQAAAKDPSLKVTIPDPSFALPSVIAMAPGLSAEQAKDAERFIRFTMSPKTQALRMANEEGDGFYWPLTTDVEATHDMPPLSALSVQRLDAAKWGPLENTINAWFSTAVLAK